MKAVNLRCEYLPCPLGIGVPSPRLFWTAEGGKKQTGFAFAYRLNGGEEVLLSREGDVMHFDFPFPLSSRDRVEYRLALRDENGLRGEWSETAWFEIGLLEESAWRGEWIRGDYRAKKTRRYPVDLFEKEFTLPPCSRARLYLSALGLYEAEINGKRVGEFRLAPGSTDYRKRVQYQTYDVTPLLKEGRNVLRLALADGWYRGSIGAKGFIAVFGKETAWIGQLDAYVDGRWETVLKSDESFAWCNDGPWRFADLKDGETVDFRKTPSFKGSAKRASVRAALCASDNVEVRERERFSPLRTFVSKTGKTVIEFPQNLAGCLACEILAKEGAEVRFVLGETLDEFRDVTLSNVQCVRKGKKTPLQEVRLFCREGRNAYRGKFMIAGFRYASFEGDAKLESVEQIALYSALEETSSFHCSNPLVDRFYRNAMWSLEKQFLRRADGLPDARADGLDGGFPGVFQRRRVFDLLRPVRPQARPRHLRPPEKERMPPANRPLQPRGLVHGRHERQRRVGGRRGADPISLRLALRR